MPVGVSGHKYMFIFMEFNYQQNITQLMEKIPFCSKCNLHKCNTPIHNNTAAMVWWVSIRKNTNIMYHLLQMPDVQFSWHLCDKPWKFASFLEGPVIIYQFPNHKNNK